MKNQKTCQEKVANSEAINNIYDALDKDRQEKVMTLQRMMKRIIADWNDIQDSGFDPQNCEIPKDITNRMKTIINNNYSATEFTLSTQIPRE